MRISDWSSDVCSADLIADAKAEILEGLEPGGTAIIPADSPYKDRLIRVAERHAGNNLTVGFASDADVRAVDTVIAANGGKLITVNLPQAELYLTVTTWESHRRGEGLSQHVVFGVRRHNKKK